MPFYITIQKKALARCNKIITISQTVKNELKNSFNLSEDDICVIPPGLDADFNISELKKKERAFGKKICNGYRGGAQ